MILPGHIAGGYLATRALLSLSHTTLPPTEITALLVIGTLAGEGPDIDLIWYSFRHRVLKSQFNDDHRKYVTHTPFLWLLACLIVVFFGWLTNSVFTEFIGCATLAGSWSHLMFDSINHGVMWLWPFSAKLFSLTDDPDPEVPGEPGTIKRYWNLIIMAHPKQATFYVEIIVTLFGIFALLHP
jgi:hypothetical protein